MLNWIREQPEKQTFLEPMTVVTTTRSIDPEGVQLQPKSRQETQTLFYPSNRPIKLQEKVMSAQLNTKRSYKEGEKRAESYS
jgi:hypothetical protein